MLIHSLLLGISVITNRGTCVCKVVRAVCVNNVNCDKFSRGRHSVASHLEKYVDELEQPETPHINDVKSLIKILNKTSKTDMCLEATCEDGQCVLGERKYECYGHLWHQLEWAGRRSEILSQKDTKTKLTFVKVLLLLLLLCDITKFVGVVTLIASRR